MDSQERHTSEKAAYGFWLYLMSDCLLFAALFATYAVLRNNTAGGASAHELFKLPFVLQETMILLTSSFVCGLAMLAVQAQKKTQAITAFAATLVLGLTFLGMEINEFATLIREGHGPKQSAFLSSYFTLVGAHGLHIAVGSLWMIILLVRFWQKGFTPVTVRQFTLLSLFWHFLDIVWIFIFSMVYLLGAS
jgi:cytochrome o ubiquinol oxidase subunit 3